MALAKLVYFGGVVLVLCAIVVSAAPTPSAGTQSEPQYVAEPTQRGTLKLFWNCFSTFILCVWTAVHPDVLPVKGSGAVNYYKFFMMTWAVILPELVVLMAMEQLLEAREIQKKWQDIFRDDGEIKHWMGLTGAFFVVMGGYVVDTGPETEMHPNPVRRNSPPSSNISQPLKRSRPLSRPFDTKPVLVTTIGAKGFEALLDQGKIRRLILEGTLGKHYFDQNLIEDKGNANTISKLLVSVQICWMIIQSAGRKASGLPITLLEVHVLIQIIYSIIAYCCWWAKPLDINRPIRLPLGPDDISHDTTRPTTDHDRDLPFITEDRAHGGWFYMFYRACYDVMKHLRRKTELWTAVLAILNGALHLIVWNSHFPSPTEKTLWRISGIGLGAFPAMVYLIMSWNEKFDDFFLKMWYMMRFEEGSRFRMFWRSLSIMSDLYRQSVRGQGLSDDMSAMVPKWLRFVLLGICTLSMILYVACILFLTVEAFISIRSLPQGAYTQVPWTAVFPHIG